jgi:hypothetical protein
MYQTIIEKGTEELKNDAMRKMMRMAAESDEDDDSTPPPPQRRAHTHPYFEDDDPIPGLREPGQMFSDEEDDR